MKTTATNTKGLNPIEFIESLGLLKDLQDGIVLLDGLDDAFVGVKTGKWPKAIYSQDKIIEILSNDMSVEDAVEYFYFNIECAYFGRQSPIIK